MSTTTFDTKAAVSEAVYGAALALDDQKWEDWLAMCDEEFHYAIRSYSPEIGKDMTYLSGDKKEMLTLTRMLPKHNTDHSPLHRHTSVYSVKMDEDGKTATAVSSVVVYQNMLDGVNSHIDAGESRLFLIGRYNDRFRIDGDEVKFVEREVRLENRRLDKGSHWPL